MATSESEADVAAKLIERLLVDPAFRARFRRNPAEACREAGLDDLAEEMQLGAGKAMMTLDMRESKSSLAGVMMAAAMEGVGIMQFAEHVAPHLDDIPEAIGDVLSRVNLPAIGGAFASAPPAAAPPLPEGDKTGDAAAGAADAAGNGGAPAPAADPSAPVAAGDPATPAAAPGGDAATPEAAAAAAEKPKSAAEQAAEKIAQKESPEAKTAEEAKAAVDKITEDAQDLPSATDLPDDTSVPKPSVDVGPDGKALTPEQAAAAPATPVAAAPAAAPVAAAPAAGTPSAPPAAVETPGGSSTPPPEPSGNAADAAASGGGSGAQALLQNKNLVLDADAQKDIREGEVDPRMIALLGKLTEKHKIELSVIKTGHDKFSSGGSVSNHFHGRGIDIARVDGEIVNPASTNARDLASEIAEISGDLRPTEVGAPWAISEPGFFTDGAHQDHLHVAFDGEPPAGFEPPAPSAAAAAVPAAPAAVAAAPAAPGAPAPAAAAAAAAPAEPKKGLSGQFMAVADAASAKEKGASGLFMAAQPPAGPPSAVASAAGSPPMVDAAAAAAAVPSGGGSSLGAAALKHAQTQLGVHEQGTNTGKEVDEYLASAKVGPGNPWCASFVTWSLEKAGHKMDGGGWAAVQTWVRNAEQGNNNLEIVDASQARPGDIVAYDWGKDSDFGADGHIGFLSSNVEGGKFTALEGNNQDQVMKVPRDVNMANVKFIRIKGDGDAPAGVAGAAAGAPAAGAPAAPPAAVETPGGSSGAAADAVAAAAPSGGANPYPGDDAGKAQLAGWLGREAEKRGLPKELPVMASLVESGVKNLNYGDADSVGFFQMRVGIWNKGDYAGFPEKPELQAKWFLDQAEAVKKQRMSRGQSVTDPNQFGEWIADVERPAAQYRGRYQLRLDEAKGLLGSSGSAPPAAPAAAAAAAAPVPGAPVAAAAAAPAEPKKGLSGQFMAVADAASAKKGGSGTFMAAQPPAGPPSAVAAPGAVPAMVDAAAAQAPGSGGSTLGAAAFKQAQTQLGVHEQGTNTGKEVDEYLASAGVGPGNPWCASFITWALEKSGHKMDGTGWAAVQTWVRNAEAGKNDLKIISADQARPGDIVAYDWGKDSDFGADGHIGFVASNVEGGKFTALEGNNQDQVMKVPRDVNMANVKFIRIGGDAPAAAGAPPVGSGAAADVAAAAAPAGGGGAGAYPGDSASKAALAKWMGDLAEKRGLPRQLPVMASLVESGVKNLNYGDADSVGFFQMRVGIWNKGAYAGFPEDPELQVKWFLDNAEQVKKARIAAGKSVSDPKQFGEWIADVERPAAQYRGRYQLRLGEANGLLGSAGGAPSAPAAVEQAVAAAPAAPGAPAAAADVAASAVGGGGGGAAGAKALAALAEAEKYTGTKYRYGGSTPQTGFDCSGLVQWAYAKAGIQIPRVTDAQFSASNGSPVERSDLRPGDLVFFGQPGNIYHVGISMGGDKFLHAPKTGDVVKVASLKEGYFSSNYAGARRFDDSAPVAAAAAATPEAAAAAAPAPIDPKAVAEAQAAVARDAAEVNRSGSGLFMAIKSQEERRRETVQFMQAIDPKQKSAEPAAAAASAPAPAPPAAVEPAAAAPASAPAPVDPAAAADAGPPVQLPDDISDDYPGDGASKDEIAKWLAKQADKHGLPPELPVMASLVESGVKNLNYGDADSVGFFQMRVGIWDQGAYKGFSKHPELQAKWFIDQALAVKKKAIASGDADFGQDPSKWGEWIADIERPAEQYRGRYQLRLREARGLLKG